MGEVEDNIDKAHRQQKIALNYQQKGIKSNIGIVCILILILSCICSPFLIGLGS